MPKARVAITIDEAVLAAAEAAGSGNRSGAVEELVRAGLGLSGLKAAAVLPGGVPALPELVLLLRELEIQRMLAVDDTGGAAASLAQLFPEAELRSAPAAFGDAAALNLEAAYLGPAFLIISGPGAPPASLLAAAAAHLRSGAAATQLVRTADGLSYAPAGLTFAGPELLRTVPAGFSTLAETVFPALAASGRLVPYAI